MAFVVVEQDSFIGSDLLEMLSEAFPDEPLRMVDELSLGRQAMKEMTEVEGRVIALVRASASDVASLIASLGAAGSKCAAVILGEDAVFAQSDGNAPLWPVVPCPFSTEMVLNAINDARARLPATQ